MQRTLCFGYIDMNQRKEAHPTGERIQVAVTNTPAEAISALLIESAGQDLQTAGRMKEEEKLEALLSLDDLSNLKLDMAARLRERVMRKDLHAHEGLSNWRRVLEDKKDVPSSAMTPKYLFPL